MGSRYGRDPFRASTGGFQEDSDDRIRSGTRYASPPRQRQARRQPFEFDELGEARLGPERSGPLVRMPIRDRLAPPEPRYGAPERVERRRYHEEDDEREVIRESGRPRDGRRLEELRETRERYHEEDDEYSASTRPRPRNHSFGAIERRPRYDEYERERERDTRDFRERDVYERDVYERDVRQREEYRAPAPAPRAPPPETRFNERYYEDVEVDYAPRRRPEAYEYERIRETEVERRRSPSAVSSASSESHAPSATRKHTKKGSTRIPKKLGSRRAVVELGYPYSEEVSICLLSVGECIADPLAGRHDRYWESIESRADRRSRCAERNYPSR